MQLSTASGLVRVIRTGNVHSFLCPLRRCSFILGGTIKTCKRHFWNPFGPTSKHRGGISTVWSDSTNSSSDNCSAPVSDFEGGDVPVKVNHDAMLHNERLRDACMELLSLCGVGASGYSVGGLPCNGIDNESNDAIMTVVCDTLQGISTTPAEQFTKVYNALCFPTVANHQKLQRSLLVVLEAILPEVLFRVFESADLFVVGPEHAKSREALVLFVRALLGTVDVPEGIQREEIILLYLDDVRNAFPFLRTNADFQELANNTVKMALRALQLSLISQLCAEMDKKETGHIDLGELQSMVEGVLGPEGAQLLLHGANPNKEGKIRYTQFASLVTSSLVVLKSGD